jgi:glyoxylase-like metal-dependent hydrolase (beta-lactamase superfamily II)
MIKVNVLPLNPWQENTFILSDETNQCVIIDPGCLTETEQDQISAFIESNDLIPVALLHTHLHLDHVFGTRFIAEKYNLQPQAHMDDEFLIDQTTNYALQFGVQLEDNPPPLGNYLTEEKTVTFGQSSLQVLHLPGHSPGGVAFYSAHDGFVIAGDVLFRESIGRTDLPGGDYETLINGIQHKLLTLPDETVVYPGHGPATTIQHEKSNNPFFKN